jgi:hypothetical protein
MRSGVLFLNKFAATLAVAAVLAAPLLAIAEETVVPPPQAVDRQAEQEPVAPTEEQKSRILKLPALPSLPTLPPLDESLENAVSVTDAPRDYLSEKFLGFVNGVDRFFGDDRNFQESRDSVLQFDITRVSGYGSEHKFVYSGRAKVHLPNTEKKLHLLIESDPEKSTSTDASRNQPLQTGVAPAPKSLGAGVRFEKAEDERWHYSTDGGLKFQGLNTAPFARTRISYAQPFDLWQLKAAETLFWFNTIGAGETTQLDLERPISEPLLFRATSNATWLHDKQNMDLRQDFTLFHKIDDRNALLYQASAIGVSRPNTHVTDYVLLLLYRYRLHRQWMYLELSPQLHFPEGRNYRRSGMLSMRLEILFDESR